MEQVIIAQNEDGSVRLIAPVTDCGIPIEEIARKDTPAGYPYRIVNSSDLPQDHTFFDAWEADFSNPDGYGIGPEAWFAEQENK